MSEGAVVRPASDGDLEACVGIVRALRDFFTPDVPTVVRREFARHRTWVITVEGAVIGFTMIDVRSAAVAEVLWTGIAPDRRGAGHGTALIEHVFGLLAREGIKLVEVKTLDRGADYPAYEATRRFWERRGFVQVDTIDPLPGWEPGNPCAIYVASLEPTRRKIVTPR